MKTYKYNIGGQALTIRVDIERAAISDIRLDDAPLSVEPADMPPYVVAIALALLESDVEVVHDDEPDVITLQHAPTPWGNPAESLKRQGSVLKHLLGW